MLPASNSTLQGIRPGHTCGGAPLDCPEAVLAGGESVLGGEPLKAEGLPDSWEGLADEMPLEVLAGCLRELPKPGLGARAPLPLSCTPLCSHPLHLQALKDV